MFYPVASTANRELRVDIFFHSGGVCAPWVECLHNGITGDYGDRERHSRVSAEAPWIHATLGGRRVLDGCYDPLDGVKQMATAVLLGAAAGLGLWTWPGRRRRRHCDSGQIGRRSIGRVSRLTERSWSDTTPPTPD
jgi:hypothetical protein